MSPLKPIALVAAIAWLGAGAALAEEFSVGTIAVADVHAFATPPGTRAAAGYMRVSNTGPEDDVLLGVDSERYRTMIHRTETVDGVTGMRHRADGVPIPAGETVAFEPGGYHVMFMGLETRFEAGQREHATLVFEKAGSVDVVFEIVDRRHRHDAGTNHGH